jgi:hypothetical protein
LLNGVIARVAARKNNLARRNGDYTVGVTEWPGGNFTRSGLRVVQVGDHKLGPGPGPVGDVEEQLVVLGQIGRCRPVADSADRVRSAVILLDDAALPANEEVLGE